jgi:hypothetical protein
MVSFCVIHAIFNFPEMSVFNIAIYLLGATGTFLVTIGEYQWVALSLSTIAALSFALDELQSKPLLVKYNAGYSQLVGLQAW